MVSHADLGNLAVRVFTLQRRVSGWCNVNYGLVHSIFQTRTYQTLASPRSKNAEREPGRRLYCRESICDGEFTGVLIGQ